MIMDSLSLAVTVAAVIITLTGLATWICHKTASDNLAMAMQCVVLTSDAFVLRHRRQYNS